MADVAATAGVSHQTVSRVLNGAGGVREETRTGVLRAIESLGYRRNSAARMLVTNRSGRIGVVTGDMMLYGPRMIAEAVQEAAHAAGYEVSVIGLNEFTVGRMRDAFDRQLDQAVEALVVALGHRDAIAATTAFGVSIPLVLAQAVTAGQPMAAGVDQLAGAVVATDHLLDLGHRQVAHVSGPPEWVEAQQRRSGWRLAHQRRGLRPGPEIAGDWSAHSGYEAGLRISADRAQTAILVASDAMALGVLKALHEHGRRVPEDISIVGFDGVPESAYYWPGLTTVVQDFSALGRRALELALRAIDGEEAPAADLVAPQIVVRGSTSPRQRSAGHD